MREIVGPTVEITVPTFPSKYLALFLSVRKEWLLYTGCLYSEYICNETCLPYTTICDGVPDCLDADGTAVDEVAIYCSGEISEIMIQVGVVTDSIPSTSSLQDVLLDPLTVSSIPQYKNVCRLKPSAMAQLSAQLVSMSYFAAQVCYRL